VEGTGPYNDIQFYHSLSVAQKSLPVRFPKVGNMHQSRSQSDRRVLVASPCRSLASWLRCKPLPYDDTTLPQRTGTTRGQRPGEIAEYCAWAADQAEVAHLKVARSVLALTLLSGAASNPHNVDRSHHRRRRSARHPGRKPRAPALASVESGRRISSSPRPRRTSRKTSRSARPRSAFLRGATTSFPLR
jgi:hypothetical protein